MSLFQSLVGRRLPSTLGLVIPLALGVSSCSNDSPASDDRRINDALLETLTAGSASLCVDSGTYGEPLAIYRTMKLAPDEVRRLLHWSTPEPLRTGRTFTSRELVDDELGDGRSMLPDATQDKTRLSLLAQAQLNGLADMATLVVSESGVWLQNSASAPRARVRWWLLNRLDPQCTATFTVSKPVVKRGVAFVTVTAAHHGTTYAFQKKGTNWATVAKWSNWLY